MEELNLGPPKTNPSSSREEDLNPGPPDYKSSDQPLGHVRLPQKLCLETFKKLNLDSGITLPGASVYKVQPG